MNEIIQIALMLLSLILPAQHQPHAPHAPRGYLDCSFNERQIYQCRP